MNRKIVNVGFALSILLHLIILFLFGSTIYKESKNAVKEIIREYKTSNATSDIRYYNGLELNVNGKFNAENNYARLPIKYKEKVRSKVWDLSENSSGISIGFITNSPDISMKWEVSSFGDFSNINKIAASGLDLYCFIEGEWQYVKSGVPTGLENEQILIEKMDTLMKEFIVNLPLYDGLEKIEIGIRNGYELTESIDTFKTNKPLVFYGTSITQGASASRPGLAYPSIISRELDIETINLGFSDNAIFENSIGQAMCEIDAEMYILDCVPNSSPEIIKANTLELIKQLKMCKPDTPVLLVEGIVSEYAYFQKTEKSVFGGMKYIHAQNEALRRSYELALDSGLENVFYLQSDGLIGYDHEGTVDGLHPNDLGMNRIADRIGQAIKKILESI